MFPLAGAEYPRTSEELAAALQEGLGEVLKFPAGHIAVVTEGGVYPAIEKVKVDLSGASVAAAAPPPPPKPRGEREAGPTVGELAVVGKPILYQGRPIEFELNARGAKFDFARDERGKAMLVAREAESGNVAVNIAGEDLKYILRTAAAEGARRQGVTIQDLDVKLTNQGPRTVDANVRAKARKMVMSGTVTLRGRVDIDDALVATVSNLSCAGEGMMGNMAAGMIQGVLRSYEGKRFPLTTFSMGGLALRDLQISTATGLRVTAAVGRK
jgi:hypothetical protein